jgi:hypothetical protein
MTNIAPEVVEERPPVQIGDTVELRLRGFSVVGTLLKVMSGEGQTDGLLKVQEEVEGGVVFVYERHVQTVRRLA